MINPDRVELVRLRLGLTKIGFAAELGVDRKAIQRFETGEAALPEACLHRLSQLSGYPSEFFSKGDVEFPNPKAVSFRSLRSLTSGRRDAALAAGALAFELDDWIYTRYERPAHQLKALELTSPAQAAEHLRGHWGIGERPIGNLINLLESKGVRVFSLAEETRHLDAYSFWRNETPYIFLNTMKTTERSRFDAAHELGHLVLHRHTGSSHPNAEHEANTFASAFLMPSADLLAEVRRVYSVNDLITAKRRWGVSASALNYALHKLGRITDWHYRSHNITLGQFADEPNSLPRESSQVWTKILADLWRQGISISRIANALSIPEFELNGLLFGIASNPQAPVASGGGRLKIVERDA